MPEEEREELHSMSMYVEIRNQISVVSEEKMFSLSSTCFTVQSLMKVIHLRIRGLKTIRITDGGMFLCQSFVRRS